VCNNYDTNASETTVDVRTRVSLYTRWTTTGPPRRYHHHHPYVDWQRPIRRSVTARTSVGQGPYDRRPIVILPSYHRVRALLELRIHYVIFAPCRPTNDQKTITMNNVNTTTNTKISATAKRKLDYYHTFNVSIVNINITEHILLLIYNI